MAHQHVSRTTSYASRLTPAIWQHLPQALPTLRPRSISDTSYLRHLHMFILAHPHNYLHFLSHLIIPTYICITLFYTLGGRAVGVPQHKLTWLPSLQNVGYVWRGFMANNFTATSGPTGGRGGSLYL